MPKLKKPKWGKPKLIVLTRGKPEEGLLSACKGDSWAGTAYDEVSRCQFVLVSSCLATCEHVAVS